MVFTVNASSRRPSCFLAHVKCRCRGWGPRIRAIFTNHHHIISLYSNVAAILWVNTYEKKKMNTTTSFFFMPLLSSTCVLVYPWSRLTIVLNLTKRFDRNLCLSVTFICFCVFISTSFYLWRECTKSASAYASYSASLPSFSVNFSQ